MAITLKYRLNETSGTSVSDSVGSNTGTATASYTILDGITGLARDGASGSYQIQAATAIALTTYGWSCWSKISGTISSAQRMISLYPGGTHNSYIRTNTGAEIKAANNTIEASYTMTVNDGKRHYYYAYTTPTSVDLYVDGVKRATASGTGATGSGSFSVSGHRGPGEYFKGSVDNVDIYDAHIGDGMVNNMNMLYRGFI